MPVNTNGFATPLLKLDMAELLGSATGDEAVEWPKLGL
jgi:hypothetical protein